MRRTSAPGSIDNKYVDRNLDIGREGTLILAENMNDFQEEIANTIEEAGITLDSGDQAQLSKAVVLTGGDKDQQVTGIKSFTKIPVLPASNPTTGNQATRKTYVDSLNAANVKLTGNQSIGGTKTFSSSPVVPTPTSASHAARKDYVDGLDAANVKLTGNQSISGTKTFISNPNVPSQTSGGHAANKIYVDGSIDGLFAGVVSLNTTQTITGAKTFSSVTSFGASIYPRTNPTTGFVLISVGESHTPTRGLYNGYMSIAAAVTFSSGPYSGTSATSVRNSSGLTSNWYYARF